MSLVDPKLGGPPNVLGSEAALRSLFCSDRSLNKDVSEEGTEGIYIEYPKNQKIVVGENSQNLDYLGRD